MHNLIPISHHPTLGKFKCTIQINILNMRTLNYKKIVAIFAFLALAGFSCFWTAESLYIWQPSITLAGAWLIAIVFYIVASLCFTLFLKGFDRNEYFQPGLFSSRGGHLFFGFIGLLLFWIMVSLPTNTHTLLYRASIKNVITTDLNRTLGYLQELKDNNVEINNVEAKYNSKKEAIDALVLRLIAEIDNPSAIGIGQRFEKILVELDAELGTTIQRTTNVGSTRTQWLTTVNYYQTQAYAQLKLYRAECDKEIERIRDLMNSPELNGLIENCKIALNDINQMQDVNNEVIGVAVNDLTSGYAFIKTNSQYLMLKEKDIERYTREGAMPEAKEMLSVPDVWKDFLTTDKYYGHGFIWWVFIALLVDLSAFIFFDIAFNKEGNNLSI